MTIIGKRKCKIQQLVLRLFQSALGYRYLSDWLIRQGHEKRLINRALRELDQAVAISPCALSQSCASIFAGPMVEGADA